ncbi:hypothetical protein HPP92_006582 [Vanilla planifolia]|uniref:Tubby C-terminal domain-containing protein n=1 Tax=Vanilla planifolia TaxID=51239 RepID=A0A835RIP1_VANPL|nr:hypothetical protein HPP92_006582 [Vanilla planifolia]
MASAFVVLYLLVLIHLLAAVIVDTGKFLLSAKRSRRTTSTEYIISIWMPTTFQRSSHTYIGKLRSNFLGMKFIIYDAHRLYNVVSICPPVRSSEDLLLQESFPKVPTGSYNISQASYELNVLAIMRSSSDTLCDVFNPASPSKLADPSQSTGPTFLPPHPKIHFAACRPDPLRSWIAQWTQ